MQMETETAKGNPVESSSTMLIIPGAQVEMEPEIDIGDLGKPDALDYFQSLNSFSKYWLVGQLKGTISQFWMFLLYIWTKGVPF